MATDSIMGLFVTPEQYQQSQRQQVEAQLAQEAQMDPYARVNYLAGMSGYGLGKLAGGLMGAEDPMMRIQSIRAQVMQQVDQTNPQSLAQAAQALNQAGDVQGARALAQAAQEAAVKQSQVARNLREAKTSEQRNYETAVDQGYKGTLQDFILEQKKAGASKTNIGITQKQEEAVTKSNVEAFGTLRDQAIAAGRTLESVQALKPLIDKSFTGFAANQKLTAGQIADTFGIPVQGTSETERLKSIQNNLKIGNSTVLKGSLSDKDMAILGDAIGQGNTTAAGLKGIISDIEKTSLIAQRQYQKANEYQQQGRLSQYDFVGGDKEARAEVNAKLKRIAELEAKANKGR